MLGFFQRTVGPYLEQPCRTYLSTAWYESIGSYLWPDALVKTPSFCSRLAFDTLEEACHWVSELDPRVTMVATAGVAIIAAGALYWLTHRKGKVVAKPMTTETMPSINEAVTATCTDTPTVTSEVEQIAVNATHHQDEATDIIQPEIQTSSLPTTYVADPRLQLAQILQEAPRIERVKPEAPQPVAEQAQAPLVQQKMPVDTICRTYLNIYAKKNPEINHMRIHYAANKVANQRIILENLGFPIDGHVPTDPASVANYNDKLDTLGLVEYKIR